MIRINLLPQKREARRDGGQGWLIAVMAVLAVELVGFGLYHQLKLQELNKQRQVNAELQNQISQIESTVKNHTEVKQKLDALRAREESIGKLQAARTGPTAVLLELAKILTPGRGPSIPEDELMQKRKDNPQDVHNIGWDARRLWLTSVTESQRVMKLDGYAKDGDDVSELARRLALSQYFYDVVLLPAKKETVPNTNTSLVRFQLQAKVRY